MPTIYRFGKYRFYFNSREESRRHIHIECSDGTAKFWLEPYIELSVSYSMTDAMIREIFFIVTEKKDDFIKEWNIHFGI